MSAALKEEGNRKFKEGDFSGAVEAYSQSLEHDPEQHLCYSNRSAAYLKLGMFEKALLDAESCTKMAPEFPKGRLDELRPRHRTRAIAWGGS
eukprot:g24616.t1